MRRILLGLMIFLCSWTARAEDYWTYHEYIGLNPAQKGIVAEFSKIVREQARPLNGDVRPVKVAVVYPGKQVSDYWWRSVSSFEARLREYKIPYEISPYFTEPGVDVRLQERQIAEALAHDPDYLIFTLDAFRHRSMIERIMQRGRPKLILQNITTPVRAWGERQPFMYVGFDHAVGSRLLAQKFEDLFPDETPYALFYGTQGYVSSMRGDTFLRYVEKSRNARLLESYYLDFNREKSKNAALIVLQNYPDLPFIFACSTDIALGVIDAAKELNMLGRVRVNGWGGGSDELKAVLEGELAFTVMRMNDDNGVAMADGIALDIQGRSTEVPTVYSGDMELIEKGVSVEYIDKLRNHAFRYSERWQTKTDQVVTYDGR